MSMTHDEFEASAKKFCDEFNAVAAMKQALEALESCIETIDAEFGEGRSFDQLNELWKLPEGSENHIQAARALRVAITEATINETETVEPVAWMLITAYGEEDDITYEDPSDRLLPGWSYRPLYTHPPRREWQGLTDEEKRQCAQAMDAEPLAEGWPELVKFARAIEAKLKEKNT